MPPGLDLAALKLCTNEHKENVDDASRSVARWMVPTLAHVGSVDLAHRYCWTHCSHYLLRNEGKVGFGQKVRVCIAGTNE